MGTGATDLSTPLREEQVQPLLDSLAPLQRDHSIEREKNSNAVTSIFQPSRQQSAEYMERRFATIEEFIERKRSAAALQLDSEQMAIYNSMLDRDLKRAREDLKSSYLSDYEGLDGP
jgi:hypothetical protein